MITSRLPGGTISHTDYDWNKTGTRIRCTLEDCLEVFEVTTQPGDVDEADDLFLDHQVKTIRALGPVPVELAALRILRDTLHEVIADLSHDVSPLVVQAKLTKVLAEAQHAVALADGMVFGPGTVEAVEPEPAGHTPAAAPEPPIIPEPAEVDPAAAEPEPELVEASEGHGRDHNHAETPAPVLTLVPAPDTAAEPEAVIEDLGVAVGDRVLATFRTPRQGDFTLEATVVKGLGLGQLIVGSWVISSSGVRSRHLLDIKVLAPAGEHEHPVKGVFEASEHLGTGV